MPRLRIELEVTIVSALAIGAGGSAGTLADRATVRDSRGLPLIPGSQVKGKIRHSAEMLLASLDQPVQRHFDDDDGAPNLIRELFGSPRHRSPLRFADLRCDVEVEHAAALGLTEVRPSVAISRRRGNAEDERLVLIEAARPQLRFVAGEAIAGVISQPAHAALLWAAARLTTRWGGAKSRGLGWAEVRPRVFLDDAAEPLGDDKLAAALRTLVPAGGDR